MQSNSRAPLHHHRSHAINYAVEQDWFLVDHTRNGKFNLDSLNLKNGFALAVLQFYLTLADVFGFGGTKGRFGALMTTIFGLGSTLKWSRAYCYKGWAELQAKKLIAVHQKPLPGKRGVTVDFLPRLFELLSPPRSHLELVHSTDDPEIEKNTVESKNTPTLCDVSSPVYEKDIYNWTEIQTQISVSQDPVLIVSNARRSDDRAEPQKNKTEDLPDFLRELHEKFVTPTPASSSSKSMTPTPASSSSKSMTPTPASSSSKSMTPTPASSSSKSMTPTPASKIRFNQILLNNRASKRIYNAILMSLYCVAEIDGIRGYERRWLLSRAITEIDWPDCPSHSGIDYSHWGLKWPGMSKLDRNHIIRTEFLPYLRNKATDPVDFKEDYGEEQQLPEIDQTSEIETIKRFQEYVEQGEMTEEEAAILLHARRNVWFRRKELERVDF